MHPDSNRAVVGGDPRWMTDRLLLCPCCMLAWRSYLPLAVRRARSVPRDEGLPALLYTNTYNCVVVSPSHPVYIHIYTKLTIS